MEWLGHATRTCTRSAHRYKEVKRICCCHDSWLVWLLKNRMHGVLVKLWVHCHLHMLLSKCNMCDLGAVDQSMLWHTAQPERNSLYNSKLCIVSASHPEPPAGSLQNQTYGFGASPSCLSSTHRAIMSTQWIHLLAGTVPILFSEGTRITKSI